MNELMYNFLNQVEDINKVKEMSVEEFIKLVKSNKLISEEDAKQLIDSFKKISSVKNESDDSNNSDERKKKYREPNFNINSKLNVKEDNTVDVKKKEDNSIER